MFSLGSFSIFFWTLAGIILLMLVFEDKLLILEEEYDRKKALKKREKYEKHPKSAKVSQAKRIETSAKIERKSGRISRNYAA